MANRTGRLNFPSQETTPTSNLRPGLLAGVFFGGGTLVSLVIPADGAERGGEPGPRITKTTAYLL